MIPTKTDLTELEAKSFEFFKGTRTRVDIDCFKKQLYRYLHTNIIVTQLFLVSFCLVIKITFVKFYIATPNKKRLRTQIVSVRRAILDH